MSAENNKKDVLLDYTFVLDASGSMQSDIDEVREELNAQVAQLQRDFESTGRPCRITIAKFDTQYTILRDQVAVEHMEPITDREYFAGGMTALYDAIGLSVKRADARMEYKIRRGEGEALVVVFTDGGENSSSEFDAHQISQLLRDYQEREGWEIALVGTDIGAIQDMGRRNMNRSKMRHYEQREKRRAMYNLSSSVSDYYTAKDSSIILSKEAFLEKQRREREERNRENRR
jgi:uncharacterized protein YegL